MTLAERIERVLENAPCRRCGLGREAAAHHRGTKGDVRCRFVMDTYVAARVIATALEREGATR